MDRLTVTDDDIRQLRTQAEGAGDLEQAALCVLALGGREYLADSEPGTPWRALYDRGMSAASARAECEGVILAVRSDRLAEELGLASQRLTEGWTVRDQSGQRWWPNEEGRTLLEEGPDPGRVAILLCEGTRYGTWHR